MPRDLFKTLSILAALAGVLAFAGEAKACSCFSWPSPCDAYRAADAVFVGTVAGSEYVADLFRDRLTDASGKPMTTVYGGWKSRVRIERVYKGKPVEEIVLALDGATSCGIGKGPVEGAKLLLYANYNQELKLWTAPTGCGRSLGWPADEDRFFLDQLPRSFERTRVAGRLTLFDRSATTPLAKTKVVVTGRGQTFEVETNENGFYEIYDLPKGAYTLRPAAPSDLKLNLYNLIGLTPSIGSLPTAPGEPPALYVEPGKCAGGIDFRYERRAAGKENEK